MDKKLVFITAILAFLLNVPKFVNMIKDHPYPIFPAIQSNITSNTANVLLIIHNVAALALDVILMRAIVSGHPQYYKDDIGTAFVAFLVSTLPISYNLGPLAWYLAIPINLIFLRLLGQKLREDEFLDMFFILNTPVYIETIFLLLKVFF